MNKINSSANNKMKTETKIYKNKILFDKREDHFINGVDREFANKNTSYRKDNNKNIGCWNCINCQNCISCFDSKNLKNLFFIKNNNKLKG